MDSINFFKYKTIKPGIEQYSINLNELYTNEKERKSFEEKWPDFLNSDTTNRDVFWKEEENLSYLSESLIPELVDERPPLLLVFGNPAPHSVKEGMFFSYEGNGREHRMWKILDSVGILSFNYTDLNESFNAVRKSQLNNLEYKSQFRIGMIPFYSIATTPSALPWTGVSGLYRLFGTKAMMKIAAAEKQRLNKIIKQFIGSRGLIIAFQKDAYTFLSSIDAPHYSRELALQADLVSKYEEGSNIIVSGSPPTRSLHGTKAKAALKTIVNNYLTGR